MKLFKNLFLVGAALLTGSDAQDNVIGSEIVSGWTWPHDHKTALYSITRVTPATLKPGQTYQAATERFWTWTKRVGLAWYFDRICPCNWGCDPRFCQWCANDNRFPEWYSRSDLLADQDGVEPAAMHPIYDCNDDLDTGVVIDMEPLQVDYANYQVEVKTDLVADYSQKSYEVGWVTPPRVGNWDIAKVQIRNVDIYVKHYTPSAIDIINTGFGDGIVFAPAGVRFAYVWWNLTYNMVSAWGGRNRLTFGIENYFEFPKDMDVLAHYQIFTQRIEGSLLADVMTQSRTGSPYIQWKMSIPRANYFVYIRSDDNEGWNYYYPKVNEILCGPAAEPPVCRTHDQLKGRIVNRVYSEFEGYVAPYVNRSLYDWDIATLGTHTSSKFNLDNRHQRTLLSVDRVPYNTFWYTRKANEDNEAIRQRALQDEDFTGIYVERDLEIEHGIDPTFTDYSRNEKNPHLSYKLY